MTEKTLTVTEQLLLLKLQTQMTGGLHEAQVKHLKMWPVVAFGVRAQDSEFTWDPDKKIVSFTVTLGKGKKHGPDWWKPRVASVNAWVQFLLGDDWVITVKTGGKTAKTFKGKRKASKDGINHPKPGPAPSSAD